jgi:hypothetical protein
MPTNFYRLPRHMIDGPPTPVPTKTTVSQDHQSVYDHILQHGFILIECPVQDQQVYSRGPSGTPEAPQVKQFVSWCSGNRTPMRPSATRVAEDRWVVQLVPRRPPKPTPETPTPETGETP